jgi:hypothetical protein
MPFNLLESRSFGILCLVPLVSRCWVTYLDPGHLQKVISPEIYYPSAPVYLNLWVSINKYHRVCSEAESYCSRACTSMCAVWVVVGLRERHDILGNTHRPRLRLSDEDWPAEALISTHPVPVADRWPNSSLSVLTHRLYGLAKGLSMACSKGVLPGWKYILGDFYSRWRGTGPTKIYRTAGKERRKRKRRKGYHY